MEVELQNLEAANTMQSWSPELYAYGVGGEGPWPEFTNSGENFEEHVAGLPMQIGRPTSPHVDFREWLTVGQAWSGEESIEGGVATMDVATDGISDREGGGSFPTVVPQSPGGWSQADRAPIPTPAPADAAGQGLAAAQRALTATPRPRPAAIWPPWSTQGQAPEGRAAGPQLRPRANVDAAPTAAPAVPPAVPRRRRSRRTGAWSDAQLSTVVAAVESGSAMATVLRAFGIPASSLRDHLYGRTMQRKKGRQGVLSEEEEGALVKWMLDMQDVAHPISIIELRTKVTEITQERWTPFRDGVPGRGWLRWFRNRHPELTLQTP